MLIVAGSKCDGSHASTLKQLQMEECALFGRLGMSRALTKTSASRKKLYQFVKVRASLEQIVNLRQREWSVRLIQPPNKRSQTE